MSGMDDILSVEDVAAELHLSKESTRRLMSSGKIPSRRLGRRLYTLRRDLLGVLAGGSPECPRRCGPVVGGVCNCGEVGG